MLWADDGETHLALFIYVGVVDLGLECDLGRLERVLCRKHYLNLECSSAVRWVLLGVGTRRVSVCVCVDRGRVSVCVG